MRSQFSSIGRTRGSSGTAGLILRDRGWAEDAAQDALVRAWRDLPSLRDPDRFDAWLHRLLVHACQDQLRRHRHELTEVGAAIPAADRRRHVLLSASRTATSSNAGCAI